MDTGSSGSPEVDSRSLFDDFSLSESFWLCSRPAIFTQFLRVLGRSNSCSWPGINARVIFESTAPGAEIVVGECLKRDCMTIRDCLDNVQQDLGVLLMSELARRLIWYLSDSLGGYLDTA